MYRKGVHNSHYSHYSLLCQISAGFMCTRNVFHLLLSFIFCFIYESSSSLRRLDKAAIWRRLASARSNQSAQPRRHSKPSCWPTGPSPSRSPIRSRSRNRCRNRSQAAPDAASRVNPAGLIRSDRNPPRTHIHERHTHNGHKNPTTIGQSDRTKLDLRINNQYKHDVRYKLILLKAFGISDWEISLPRAAKKLNSCY
uniref:HDC13141 n=1 Tax=Drosophila melanogaster TaxID=7227 RepID=Q6IK89_DROME|nr:TPA_inf: HDC13141 [Drosophila melanogaster]